MFYAIDELGNRSTRRAESDCKGHPMPGVRRDSSAAAVIAPDADARRISREVREQIAVASISKVIDLKERKPFLVIFVRQEGIHDERPLIHLVAVTVWHGPVPHHIRKLRRGRPGKTHHFGGHSSYIGNSERCRRPKLRLALCRAACSIKIFERRANRGGQISVFKIP